MPENEYLIVRKGKSQSYSAEDFNSPEIQNWLGQNTDAESYEVSAYNPNDKTLDGDSFRITNPKGKSQDYTREDIESPEMQEWIAQNPDFKVSRVRPTGAYGDSLRREYMTGENLSKIYERMGQLDDEMKTLKPDTGAADLRNMDDEQLAAAAEQAVSPDAKRRREIYKEYEKLRAERDKNPVWKRYWERESHDIEDSISRVDDTFKALDEAYPESAKLRHEMSFAPDRTGIAESELRKDILNKTHEGYWRDFSALQAADYFYKEAQKVASAPSKYGDELGIANYWKGIADTGWSALSVVSLANAMNNIPLLDAVKKIQEYAGKDANIKEIVLEHPKDMWYLSEAQKEMMRSFVKRGDVEQMRSDNLSKGYQAGKSFAQSVGFMADFLLLGGAGELAADAVVGKAVEKAAEGTLARIGAESLYGLVKATAMTPLMPSSYSSILNSIAQLDENGGMDLSGKTVLKAVGDAWIENVSETIGAKPLEVLGWGIGKAIPSDWISKTTFGGWANAIRHSPWFNSLKQTGYNGFVEEMFEEVTGGALRWITGVDKEALGQFLQPEQLMITAASFAPMTLVGGVPSTISFAKASRAVADREAEITKILQSQNIPEERIKEMFAAKYDSENAEDLGRQMAGFYDEAVKAGVPEAEALKAFQDYAYAVSKYRVQEGAFEQYKDEERTKQSMQITNTVGGEKWYHAGIDGNNYVRTLTGPDGGVSYVTGEDDETIITADSVTGEPKFVKKEGIADGAYTDSGEIPINTYLDDIVKKQAASEDQQRIQQEKARAIADLNNNIANNTPVPMGTEEQPVDGIIVKDENGVAVKDENGNLIVETPDGRTPISAEDLANKWGIRLQPKTKEEVEADAVAEEEAAQKRKRAYNTIQPGTKVMANLEGFDEPQEYTFVRAIYDENEQAIQIRVIDPVTNQEVGLPESAFPDLSVAATQLVENGLVEAESDEKVQDNTPRDSKGRPLPLNSDGTVNQKELWDNDPQAWTEWNDKRRQDGGANSIGYVQAAINSEQAAISDAEKQYASELDFDKREALEKYIEDRKKRLSTLNGILQSYQKRAEAREQAQEQAAAKRDESIPAEVSQLTTQQQAAADEEQRRIPLRARAQEWADKTGVPVELMETPEDVQDQKAREAIAAGQRVTGWYDPNTGKVYIYVPNIRNEAEIDKTYIHEVISHKGLKEMLGVGFNTLLDHVWSDLMNEEQRQFYTNYVKMTQPNAEGKALERAAADEYIAALSEKIGLESVSEEELSNWEKFVKMIRDFFMQMLTGGVKITEEDLSDLLVASMARYKEIKEKGDAMPLMRASGENGAKDLSTEALTNEIQKEMAEKGLVMDGGVVMDEQQAKLKEDTGYKTPNELDEESNPITGDVRFSITTVEPWERNYMSYPGAEQRVVDSIEHLVERMTANELVYGVVPTGIYKYGEKTSGSKAGPLRTNIEYIVTFDMDTSCPRSLQYLAFARKIESQIGRPLTQTESIQLIEMMRVYGQMIPCVYCYCENKRQALKQYYTDFLASRHGVISAKTEAEALAAMYGHKATKDARESNDPAVVLTDAAYKVYQRWRNEKRYNPTIRQLWSQYRNDRNVALTILDDMYASGVISTGMDDEAIAKKLYADLRVTDPLAQKALEEIVSDWKWNRIEDRPHDDFTRVANEDDLVVSEDTLALWREMTLYGKSASQAKNTLRYVPYTDELKTLSKKERDYINGMGGLRMHSSNDFRLDYVLDYFQFMADMAVNKMFGHTYTKSPEFVRIFGNSGYKINMSIAAYEDSRGIRPNAAEGFEWSTAQELRRLFPNAGTMLMATSDRQVQFALDNDWVDMCIPFHASGLPKAVWYDMRMWTDYSSTQNERFLNGDEMRAALESDGVEVPKKAKAEEVERMYIKHFGIKVVRYKTGKKKGKRFAPHFLPGPTIVDGINIPGHNNDYDTYIFLCRDYGVHPRFYGMRVKDNTPAGGGREIDVTEHPRYMILIKETARTDTPQTPIQFDFDQPSEALGGKSPIEYAFEELEARAMAESQMAGGPVRNIYESYNQDPYGIVDQFINGIIKHKEETGKDYPLDYLTPDSRKWFMTERRALEDAYKDFDTIPYHPHEYDENGNLIMEPEDQEQPEAQETAVEDAGQRALDAILESIDRKNAGEVEARNVEDRSKLSPRDRAATPPSVTEDTSRSQQTIRFRVANALQKQPVSEQMAEQVVDRFDPEILFRLSNNNRATVESWLKKREDLTDEQRASVIDYIDNLDEAKLQLATARWFANKSIRIPEDMEKVRQAVSVAGKAKVDPLQYDNPMSLLDAHANFKPTAERINPDNVPTLHKADEYPADGVTVYDVDEGEESRKNMRKIINTHFGEDASPWCLLQGDGKGNLTKDSKKYWNHYNAYPKQVAFKDGKLLAFSANDSGTKVWWDRQDTSHYGIPITKKIEGDELGRSVVHILQDEAIVDKDLLERELAEKYNCPPYRLREIASPEDIARLDEAQERVNDSYRNGWDIKFVPEGGAHPFRGNRQNGVYEEWSSDGSQILERTEYKDGKANGISETWYPNGQQNEKINVKDDHYVGPVTIWYDNGQVRVQANFDDDSRKDGKQESWFKNGNKRYDVVYKNGQLVGERKEWNEDGTLANVYEYDDIGALKSYEEHGPFGIEKRITYPNDLDRIEERFYRSGQLARIERMHDGKLEGVQEDYYTDGTIRERDNYHNGERDGLREKFHPNGQLWIRGEYKDGKKVGVHESWSRDGVLNTRTEFKSDEVVDGSPVDYLRFRVANEDQKIFISNAEKAVSDLKMDKATPEQWKKTLEKNGGLKAAEDKWLGLSTWLDGLDRKTVTKQEVLDFIAENQIQIEETRYQDVDVQQLFNEDIRDRIGRGKDLDELQEEIDELTASRPSYEDATDEDFYEDKETGMLLYQDHDAWLMDRMKERYGDDFEIGYYIADGRLEYNDPWEKYDSWDELVREMNERREVKIPNNLRKSYKTEGITNYSEIALTVPTIEPWNEEDKIHFGDAGEGRAISWARFGDTWVSSAKDEAEKKYREADKAWRDYRDEIIAKYALQATGTKRTSDLATPEENARVKELMLESLRLKDEWQRGNHAREKVLVIDEIQSKRHQEGRERGYRMRDEERTKVFETSRNAWRKYQEAQDEYTNYLASVFGEAYDPITMRVSSEDYDLISPSDEQTEHINELENITRKAKEEWLDANSKAEAFVQNHTGDIPAAPFEKDWPALTMKRMMRLAAEEGYDYLAWTTGEQQAERYKIGGVVNKIRVYLSEGQREVSLMGEGIDSTLIVDEQGNITGQSDASLGDMTGRKLSDVVGKELAVKIMGSDDGTVIQDDGLKVGGEGMKGFYDDILVRWMNKYGKKWGVKVEDIYLPALGEDAAAGAQKGLTMHSVPVTEEMKDSVMQGQTMFRVAMEEYDKESQELFDAAKERFGTTRDLREAGYILPDGSLLDFSGRHQTSGDTSFLNGRRSIDHRDIADLNYERDLNTPSGRNTSMPDFIERGAVRIDGDSGSINLAVKPTDAQMSVIRRIIERTRGEAYIDFGADNTDHYAEYDGARPDRVVNDIRRYFDEGYRPSGNTMFRITPEQDAEYMEAVNAGDMDKAQQMVENVARAAGYEYEGYHESINEFTVFEPGHRSPRTSESIDDASPVGWFSNKPNNGFYGPNAYHVFIKMRSPYILRGDSEAVRKLWQEDEQLSEEFYSTTNIRRRKEITDRRKEIKAEVERIEPFNQLVNMARWARLNYPDAGATLGETIRKVAESEFYDGIIFEDTAADGKFGQNWYIPFEGYSNIKSADPVTYDDQGNVIPLSERFNEGNDDIRFRVGSENINAGLNALEKLANGEEVVRDAMSRPDLSQYGADANVAFYWGETGDPNRNYKKGYGIAHMGAKHGPESIFRALDIIDHGDIERYVEGNKTVVLTDGEYEALLALTRSGRRETWLFNGWEKKENAGETSEVSTQSGSTQTNPTFSREDLGAAVSEYKDRINSENTNSSEEISISDEPMTATAPEVEESAIRFRKVEDPLKIAELEAGEKIPGYRTVVLNPDGSMASPMAGELGVAKAKKSEDRRVKTSSFTENTWNEAEENPDLADENGKIKLIKTDNAKRGLVDVDEVDYNPYNHLRLSPVNLQFKDAWKRPDLIYIKSEVPKSEAVDLRGIKDPAEKDRLSPYHAEKAVLPVGIHDWSGGGELLLSRWDKPVGQVAWEEIADAWANDEKVKEGVQFDRVPPQILDMLAERGIEILPPSKGKDKNEAYKAWKAGDQEAYEAWRDTGKAPKKGKNGGGNTRFRIADEDRQSAAAIVSDYDNQDGESIPWMEPSDVFDRFQNEIPYGAATEDLYALIDKYNRLDEEDLAEGRRDFSGAQRDKVFDDFMDALREFAGEDNGTRFRVAGSADELVKRVQDYGLRGILDEDAAKAFWADAYAVMPEDARRQIVDQAFSADADKQELNIRRYTRQYIADLAKKGYAEDESGLLRYLADKIKAELGQDLDENTLRYLIWRSANRYASNNILDMAEDIAMRRRLGVGEFNGEKFPTGVSEATEEAENRIDEAESEREEAREEIRRTAPRTPFAALNRAMTAQRKYDQETVASVVALAKDMIKKGNIDKVSAREMARLMTIIKDANGRKPATVKAATLQLLDFMVDHTVGKEKELLDKMLKVRTAKVREPGVDTIAKLDLRAQNIINNFRDNYQLSEAEIDRLITELEDKMADGRRTDASLEDMRSQLEGLQLAKQYAADIAALESDIKAIRQQMKDAKDEYDELSAEEKKKFRTALNEELAAGEEMIRAKKIQQVDAYRRLRGDIAKAIDEGAERAKTFLEAERERVEQIHHWANSDMQGVSADVRDRKLTGWAKFANSSFAKLFTAPLANLDQMLRTLGRKSPEGRGYLWNWMMGAVRKASDTEKLGIDAAEKKLNDKVSEIFDEPGMEWNDLYSMERKMPKAKMRYFSANGEWVEEELTQGNLLYIYMVNKMTDGRMKLRQMNITDENVEDIKKALDPRFVELADWIQEEFLPGLRDRYNETHKRLFGTSMASIENYFPLRILGGVIEEKRNVGDQEQKTLPTDITGAIIKRTVNAKQLNLAGTDAFSLVVEHVREMEHWNAYAEASRDFSTLLKYKRFQNQLKQLNTIYGAGKDLMNLFWDTVNLSVGAFRPTTTPTDKAFLNLAKGVTAAKISFRAYTAIKQILSWPAFLADTNPLVLGKNTLPINWKKNWDWAMENLPNFKKRVESRKAGLDILEDTSLDSKFWGTDFAKWINQNGMFMNAFVDALTVSIGARSVYETRKARYLKEGFSEEEADKKAKMDAEVAYNETQQSSEKEFMSTMQAHRTVANVALSAYRNSSMGYQRQLHQALRTLGRMARKGYKSESIEYMTKQLEREGLSTADAEKAAINRYERAGWQALVRVAVFGWLVQFAWNLGAHAVYLLFGDDPDEKKKMLVEDATHALIGGPIEGLAAGNIMSEAFNMIKNGENLRNWDPTTLPIMSDIKSTISKMSSDPVAGANDLVYLAAQIGLGTNPQTISDAIVAIVDACNGDFETAREVMFCIMRILAVPQSQLDQLMIDEIGMSAKDARELSYEDVARRYVDYKMSRNAPVTGPLYPDELREKREKSHATTFKKKYNERQKLKEEE